MGSSQSRSGQDAEQVSSSRDDSSSAASESSTTSADYKRGFDDGCEQVSFEAKFRMDQMREEDIMVGSICCSIVWLATATYYQQRRSSAAQDQGRNLEAFRGEVAIAAQELSQEKQRLIEVNATNELLQKQMAKLEKDLKHRQVAMEVLHQKLKLSRLSRKRLTESLNLLKPEVALLRATNGKLNQWFIASTTGAIVMSCVAAGLVLANHSSHGPAPAAAPPASSTAHQ